MFPPVATSIREKVSIGHMLPGMQRSRAAFPERSALTTRTRDTLIRGRGCARRKAIKKICAYANFPSVGRWRAGTSFLSRAKSYDVPPFGHRQCISTFTVPTNFSGKFGAGHRVPGPSLAALCITYLCSRVSPASHPVMNAFVQVTPAPLNAEALSAATIRTSLAGNRSKSLTLASYHRALNHAITCRPGTPCESSGEPVLVVPILTPPMESR